MGAESPAAVPADYAMYRAHRVIVDLPGTPVETAAPGTANPPAQAQPLAA